MRTIRRLCARVKVEQYTLSQYADTLQDRARRFGVEDTSKTTDNVLGLLHRLASKPYGQRSVAIQDLDDALAGYPNAQSLSAPDCVARLRQQLVSIAAEQGGISIADAISRADVASLLQRDDASIVLITGPGGSGKTLSVLKALYDAVDERPRLVAALMAPPSGASNSLERLVASWRSTTGAPVEPLDLSLRRIALANRDTPRPVLLLCLDGLDEARPADRIEIDALLWRFFRMHQVPMAAEALLIVTCRTRDRFKSFVAPLGTGGTPPREVPEVLLGDFSVEEFVTVWRKWFPFEAVPDIGTSDDPFATLSDANVTGMPQSVALRHPILLGCIRHWTSEKRGELIRGDNDRWRELLDLYTEWFATKAMRRNGCDRRTVLTVLRAAAVATNAEAELATFQLQKHWSLQRLPIPDLRCSS